MWSSFLRRLPFVGAQETLHFSRFSEHFSLVHHKSRRGISTQRFVPTPLLAEHYSARAAPSSSRAGRTLIYVNVPDAKGQVHEYVLGPYRKGRAQKELQGLLEQAKESKAPMYFGAAPRKRWFLRGVILFSIVIGALALTPYPGGEGGGAPAPNQSSLLGLSQTMMDNIALVSEQSGIEVYDNRAPIAAKHPVYVFSHPGCEQCTSVTEALAHLPEKYKPIIMPAGFSFDVGEILNVASAYCSESPYHAWRAYGNGDAPRAVDITECDWVEKAQASSLIADMMGVATKVEDWPLVVAPNGKITRGGYPSDALPALIDHLERNLF